MTGLGTLVEDVRARPVHVATAALALGLAAGPRAPAVLLVALIVLPLAAGGPLAALAALAALVGGAGIAQARLAELDHSPLAPRLGHAIRTRAVTLETPRATQFGWRAIASLGGEHVLLRGSGPAPPLSAGDVAQITGGLRALGPRDGWLRTRHVHAVVQADDVRRAGTRAGAQALIDAVRRRAQRALGAGVPTRPAGLLRGMVLGDDATMTLGDRNELRRAGLGHLVAASGANIALLSVLALGVASWLGLGRGVRLIAVLALIAVYVPVAGSGASIQRAGVMGAAAVVATLASRPAARWQALLLAAAVTLALDPAALDDPGWQLSFAAVVAIALLAGRVRAALVRRGLPRPVAEAGAVTCAATLGTAPVGAAVFGTVSLVALPANVLAAPAVAPITWLGMIAAVVGQVASSAALPFTAVALYPLAYVQWVGHTAAALPAAQIAAGAGPVALVCCLAALLVAGGRRGRRAALVLAPVLALALLWVALAHRRAALSGPAPGRTRATFLDIGQGDATLLQAGGHAMLVDSGPPDAPILARLRHAGVSRLDVLVATHAQADHDGGADLVLRALPVGLVLDGRDGNREPQGDEMAAAAAQRRVRLVAPVAGEVVRAGPLALRVLSPPRRTGPPVAGADPNQRAIVALGTGPGLRVLLTADAESDVLSRLSLDPVDILKISHHGSEDPGLPALLTHLRPRLAVIEVGLGNTYGHPTPPTLAALHAAGVPVRRTDLDGTVRVDASAAGLQVRTHA